jgi:hypothetical protein
MLSEAHQVELLKFAEVLADAARPGILKAHAQVDTSIEIKADGTPVTLADREAEEVMRALIKKAYPNHGILGEEFGSENADAEFCWVLDPIDGTKSFLSRVPLLPSQTYLHLVELQWPMQIVSFDYPRILFLLLQQWPVVFSFFRLQCRLMTFCSNF